MKIFVMRALVVVIVLLSFNARAQRKSDSKILRITPDDHTVCYGTAKDANVFIPPPSRLSVNGRTASVDTTGMIKVTYTGFSPEAKKAFQYAVNIWRTLIVTHDTIHINAVWQPLGSQVLGSARTTSYFANFDGAQKSGVYYPVALAEKLAGHDLNDGAPDINASFSSSFSSWYYGTDGKTPAGQYDLVTVILHEIGHGLGIIGLYTVSGTVASFPLGVGGVFDTNLENTAKTNIITTMSNTDAATAFKSNALFFNSPLVLAKNSNIHAQLFAPSTFQGGSSIYHVDETKYPKGDKNSLMTPNLATAEAIHNPGPIVMGMLKDMGWTSLTIDKTPLPNTEDVSDDFPVTITIEHDTAYKASTVKLFYSTGTTLNEAAISAGSNDQFTATIPKPSSTTTQTTYKYYVAATDNANRDFTFPGKLWTAGTATHTQIINQFIVGPDTKGPLITHTPTGFIRNTQPDLTLDALITDIIGVQGASIEYLINDVPQSDIVMVLKSTIDPTVTDSTFTGTIHWPSLNNGDMIKYRIRATDAAVAHNVSTSPASGYYNVDVISLAPTQTSYSNNFDAASSDFFGDPLFGVSTATGFTSAAINTTHPYPIADPKDSLQFVYELRIPIRISASNPTIEFDEIALVEPNDAGTVFGGSGFYDYVTVEGSTDGGTTWKSFVTGYNSRSNSGWLTKWNSSDDGTQFPNSTGKGDPSLYVNRSINMLTSGHFNAGDEVIIRFRLKSDQLASGWGWTIDNLKIQVDDNGPVILHNQIDFIKTTVSTIDFATSVADESGVKELAIEYQFNNGEIHSLPFPVQDNISQYNLILDVSGYAFVNGDEFEYRFVSTDSAGNTSTFPSSGLLKIAVLSFDSPIATYTSDFNSTNLDFAGNFFSVSKATELTDGAINSIHPYLAGFGLDNTSSITYMLKKPITVSAVNPYISLREIVLTDVVRDYVIVEGSKDQGETWVKLVAQYNSKANSAWSSAYSGNKVPTAALYKGRLIDITSAGFKAGDNVLIRFRLYSDAHTVGWGWAIDDLSIQGPITGIEQTVDSIALYPNPATEGALSITLPLNVRTGSFSMMNLQGQNVYETTLAPAEDGVQNLDVSTLSDGMYLVRIKSNLGTITHKIIVQQK